MSASFCLSVCLSIYLSIYQSQSNILGNVQAVYWSQPHNMNVFFLAVSKLQQAFLNCSAWRRKPQILCVLSAGALLTAVRVSRWTIELVSKQNNYWKGNEVAIHCTYSSFIYFISRVWYAVGVHGHVYAAWDPVGLTKNWCIKHCIFHQHRNKLEWVMISSAHKTFNAEGESKS